MPMIDTNILKPVLDLYEQAQADWFNYSEALDAEEKHGTPARQAELAAKVDQARKDLDNAAMQVADELRMVVYIAEGQTIEA
jgi:hypothetical protein